MTHRIASCSGGQRQACVASEPIRVSVCHCLACQRRTGSVSGAQARFPSTSTSVTVKSTSQAFVRVGDEGSRSTFRFCPECGSTVYCTAEGLQLSTLRNLAMAWILTLPVAMWLSGSLYWLLSKLF